MKYKIGDVLYYVELDLLCAVEAVGNYCYCLSWSEMFYWTIHKLVVEDECVKIGEL